MLSSFSSGESFHSYKSVSTPSPPRFARAPSPAVRSSDLFILFLSLFSLTNSFFIDVAQDPNFFEDGLPSFVSSDNSFADFNNDRLLDFVLIGRLLNNNTYFVKFYYQDSFSRFQDVTIDVFPDPVETPIPSFNYRLEVVDFNTDGLLDLLIIDDHVQVFLQDGYGQFRERSSDFTGIPVKTTTQGILVIKFQDYDQDGLVDLYANGLFRQTSAGVFSDVTATSFNVAPLSFQDDIDWFDLDQDGRIDLCLRTQTGGATFTMSIYRQLADHTFVSVSTNLVPFVGAAAWMDIDQNGLIDVMLTGQVAGAGGVFVFGLFYQTSLGAFVDQTSVFAFPTGIPEALPLRFPKFAVGDIDGNNLTDVLIASSQAYYSILFSQTSPGVFADIATSFEFPQDFIYPLRYGASSLGDVNGDGKDEILRSGSYYGGDGDPAILYLNGCPQQYFLATNPIACRLCFGDVSQDQSKCSPCVGDRIFNGQGCVACPSGTYANENRTACVENTETQPSDSSTASDSEKAGKVALYVVLPVVLAVLVIVFLCCCCLIVLLAAGVCFVCLVIVVLIVLLLGMFVTTVFGSLTVFKVKRGSRLRYSDLEFGEKIGEGAFGTVFEGSWKCEPVAIKKMKVLRNQEAFQDFEKEAKILRKLKHPNIVGFKGIVVGSDACYLVMELAEEGSLTSYLKRDPVKVEEKLVIIRDITSALEYLHARGIVHRDISCKNVLICDNGQAKLSDFGLAHILGKEKVYVSDNNRTGGEIGRAQRGDNKIGPVRWLPPEFNIQQTYTEASDIYMLGMFMLELLTESPPYREFATNEQVLLAIRDRRLPALPQHWPVEIQSLLLDCWQPIGQDRPSLQEIQERLAEIPIWQESSRVKIENEYIKVPVEENHNYRAVPVEVHYTGASVPAEVHYTGARASDRVVGEIARA